MKMGHQTIQRGMRRNEVEVLFRIRRDGMRRDFLLPLSWHHALDRLLAARMIKYDRNSHGYVARKGARPVTPAVR